MRFHTIIWPIMLMALGEPLPKQILGHPWLLSGEDKMSKSRGNVLYADDLVKRFGTDAVRYYLLSQMPFAQDGTITHESFITTYNADLANTLGNLVNRTVAMAGKYFDGKVSRPTGDTDPVDAELLQVVADTLAQYPVLMDGYRNADALAMIMNLAKRCNKYIDETAPWVLAKDEATKPRLEAVLYHLLDSIRLLSILLTPFLPETAEKIQQQLQIGAELTDADALAADKADTYAVGTPVPLFARIDTEKALAEIAAEQQALQAEAAKAAPENVAFLSEITIDDFAKIDLQVAKITACEKVKKSKKLLKLTLDDGSGTPRTVCSGIALWYTPDDLIGKQIVVVANLKPAKLCGVESQGMILAADDGDAAKVLFVDGVAPGSRVH